MIIIIFVASVLTNIINNVVTLTLLIPISLFFLASNGGNPLVLIALFTPIVIQGFVLPSGSAVGALLHGNEEWLSPGTICKYTILIEFVVVCVCAFIGVPIGNMLF